MHTATSTCFFSRPLVVTFPTAPLPNTLLATLLHIFWPVMVGQVTTPTKKRVIIHQIEQGMTPEEAAATVGVHRTTASRIFDRHQKGEGYYEGNEKTGRPHKLTAKDLTWAEILLYTGEARDGADLQRRFFPHVQPRTMRENLQKVGLHGRTRRAVPFIKEENQVDRKRWTESVLDWKVDDWKKVIFTDESKYRLMGSDGRSWCRRRDGDALLPQFTVKRVQGGGGKVTVWGCITAKGVGKLIRVEGNMDAIQYVRILADGVTDALKRHSLDLPDVIWQQDNDPKHTSHLAYNFFFDHDIPLLHWPANSPDINIIEHVWDYLDNRLRRRPVQPKNEEQLWEMLEEEWYRIDLEYIEALYDSMPRRVEAVYKANGWNTKY